LFRRILIFFLLAASAWAQVAVERRTVVVMPFENESKAPGLEWISEAFPEVLGERLAQASLFVIPRDDRLYAFDRLSIPAAVHPARATLYRIAQEMDADYAVLGRFTYDGQTFSGTAQVLAVKELKLYPEVTERGSLLNLLEMENALAWELLHQLDPTATTSKAAFVAASPTVRLDAFENYVRGITAGSRPETIRRLREALRLNPNYPRAQLQLGKTYFAAHDYENAAAWLGRVPRSDALAGEASFFQGLSDFYRGQFDKAEASFTFLASRFPLTEVYNNLGVVAARRGRRDAAAYFQKAVQADPNDPDYRYNLAVALARAGDSAGAARQLREALALRPGDSEAKALLDNVTAGRTADATRQPLERVKQNYDEASFRQLAMEIENATEARLRQSDPATHARAHVERGQQLLAQGFAAEAERQFREAVVLNPADPDAHTGLAAALEGSDAQAARKEIATALQLRPSAEAYLALARLDLRDNKVQDAGADVDRALALDPGNGAAQALKREIAARANAPH